MEKASIEIPAACCAASPWPALVPNIGHCALYESLLAGCADRMARGEPVDVDKIPGPDVETVRHVTELRAKATLTSDERAFLEYYEVLEQIRAALLGM
jgi:hypothetical protein